MPAGRPRKPTVLRLIEGNRGKRPPPKHEPKPRGDLKAAKPPTHLTEAQAEIWNYALDNCPPGLMTHVDRELLVAWCVASELHARATRLQAQKDADSENPLLVMTKGGLMQSPYLAIINRQAVLLVQLSAALGFSPSARTRINAPEEEGPKDPGAKYV
jgi:P27 family predicted phage terminase small subunit